MADRIEDIIKLLVEEGGRRGFLTYQEMNKLLEDQFLPPERMDQVFTALEDASVDVVDENDAQETGLESPSASVPSKTKDPALTPTPEKIVTPEKIDDPVRMYLTQMGEISMLTREQEI